MKINEFITLVKDSKHRMLKPEQLQEALKKDLEVKQYMSIKDKRNLVSEIINKCIYFDDGVYKFDEIEKYVCFTMSVIGAYTNLELSDDIEDDYDALCDAKMLNVVVNTFKSEYDELNILLQMKCENILGTNTIEAQIGRFLNGLNDKLDTLTNALSENIGKFDINNLGVNKDDVSKLLDFVNKYKK